MQQCIMLLKDWHESEEEFVLITETFRHGLSLWTSVKAAEPGGRSQDLIIPHAATRPKQKSSLKMRNSFLFIVVIMWVRCRYSCQKTSRASTFILILYWGHWNDNGFQLQHIIASNHNGVVQNWIPQISCCSLLWAIFYSVLINEGHYCCLR